MTARFAIFRIERNGFSTRGPVSKFMPLAEAVDELRRLKRDQPHVDHCILGEVGTAEQNLDVSVRIESPLKEDTAIPIRRVPRIS